ncbi:hypothetical protein FQR65_LT03980 [Abscondita terminalis]|nr:hypothetical protein FQR65_LT03980 [Abscondita terminalis]
MYSSSDYDSDSEQEFQSKKCFPVEIPEDFDPNKPPTNGEEYLHHVVHEARMCQKVASVNVDSSKFNNNQTVWFPTMDSVYVTAPKSMVPSQEWQEKIVKEFTDYRDFVLSALPKTPNSNKNDYGYWIEKMRVEYPQLNVISDFDCCVQTKILEEIVDRLQSIEPGHSIDDLLGCWIYNMLSILEKPLSSNNYLLLRDLSRLCSIIRSELHDGATTDMFVPLNIFICIIARCFGQLDLTDK